MWIKERESSHNLQVVRMGAPSTVTAMERAMEAGHSVLIENMGENIDAVLNPVITRSTFKKVCFMNRVPNTMSLLRAQAACALFLQLQQCCVCLICRNAVFEMTRIC